MPVGDGSGKPAKPDNRPLAIFMMNAFAMCSVIVSIFFKQIQADNVSVVEFTFFRNAWNLGCCLIGCLICGVNPIREVIGFNPKFRWILFARAIVGQTCFCMFMICLALLPLSLEMIFFQTSPFWVSILGICINGERVMPLEWVAMFLSFGGVVVIATAKTPQDCVDGVCPETE